MKRLKVLISAYACEPDKGSEPGVGWNMAQEIARHHDVWVITRANNRPAIEKELERTPVPNLHFVYYDLPTWSKWWKRGQRGVHLYYYLWQIGTYFVAKKLYSKINFDCVHHVTFVNYWIPSFLFLLPVPFVWGPVGGGESAPRSFYRTFSLRGRLFEVFRNFARWFGEHDPFVRWAAKRAAMALATTADTAQQLKKLGAHQVKVLPQVALSSKEIDQLITIPVHTGNPVRLLSLGRLLHWKGFHLGLEAFARMKQEFPQSEYWIIGDGPERRNLERLAKSLGVADKVHFFGALPREEALRKLAKVDLLVHPSMHESGGWVSVEAMAAGKPVICLDLGGPALQVTEETGFKIPARTPEQAIADMTEAMLWLSRSPGLRQKMGEAARRRVRELFSWERKGAEILKIYDKLVDKHM